MPKGNPNPSPSTRFKPGNPGNPAGKTSAQRKLEIENAEIATRIRNKLLLGMAERIEGLEGQELVAELRNELLKLIKDSEDRGLGAPKQDVEVNATVSTMTKEQRDAAVAAATRADR